MAFVTERNFYVRVLEKPPFWRASGVSSVCGDHKILPRNENFRSDSRRRGDARAARGDARFGGGDARVGGGGRCWPLVGGRQHFFYLLKYYVNIV